MGQKTIVIKPKQTKNLLNDEQIQYIQGVLESSCNGEVCINKGQLYDELENVLDIGKIEKYQFEKFITKAIRTGLIKGFETRFGRNGGICRAGAFAEKDSLKTKKKRSRKPKSCTVTIADVTHKVMASETQVLGFIVSVLGAKPANDGKAAIYINNGAYKLPNSIKPTTVLERFILNVFKAQKIDDDEEEFDSVVEAAGGE